MLLPLPKWLFRFNSWWYLCSLVFLSTAVLLSFATFVTRGINWKIKTCWGDSCENFSFFDYYTSFPGLIETSIFIGTTISLLTFPLLSQISDRVEQMRGFISRNSVGIVIDSIMLVQIVVIFVGIPAIIYHIGNCISALMTGLQPPEL